jgi:hypothetical protein
MKNVKKLKKGFLEAAVGVIGGIVLTVALNTLVNYSVLPRYAILIFGAINIITSLLTLNSSRVWGAVYTAGWIVGSYLFIGLMEPFDIVVNIIAPAIFIVLRLILWMKKAIFSV